MFVIYYKYHRLGVNMKRIIEIVMRMLGFERVKFTPSPEIVFTPQEAEYYNRKYKADALNALFKSLKPKKLIIIAK